MKRRKKPNLFKVKRGHILLPQCCLNCFKLFLSRLITVHIQRVTDKASQTVISVICNDTKKVLITKLGQTFLLNSAIRSITRLFLILNGKFCIFNIIVILPDAFNKLESYRSKSTSSLCVIHFPICNYTKNVLIRPSINKQC